MLLQRPATAGNSWAVNVVNVFVSRQHLGANGRQLIDSCVLYLPAIPQ